MPDREARVVLLSLDGFNHAAVSRHLTPRLWALRHAGGVAIAGGRCDLPAVTYVSHATLATGTLPRTHGLTSNLAAGRSPRPGVVPGWAGADSVGVPTIFRALREAGVRNAAICGDQHLVGAMGANQADVVWPPGGVVPPDSETCASGYATNQAVFAPLAAAIADRELTFVFGHLNETDTWGHRCGPDHPETRAFYAATDALVGDLCDLLLPDWPRLVLIMLSDHGMEPATLQPPVDLLAPAPMRDAFSDMLPDGSSALGLVREGVSVVRAGAALEHLPGIAAWSEMRPGVILIAGEPGIRFTAGPASDKVKHLRGVHGGPGSTATLALVAGGHPAVPKIARAIASRPPHLADWAPTIADLFGVPFPSAEGQNLHVRSPMLAPSALISRLRNTEFA